MKIVCNSLDLNNAVSKVQGVVESTTAIPALQGILFTAQGSQLSLTGYNLETGITTNVKSHIEQEGSVILDARRINDILRSLPASTVSISTDEKNLCTVKSGDAVFSIIGMPAGEYPDLPGITDGYTFSFSRVLLKSMIKQTRYALAKTDIKPVHKGILFEISGGEITLTAVDGYRIAVRIERADASVSDQHFIVPEKALSELVKLYGDDPGTVQISVSDKYIIFEVDGFFVISRLLEGEFIDYKSVVPKVITTKLHCEVKKLTECMERMSLLITDRLRSPVRMNIRDGEISCTCATTLGNVSDRLETPIEGEPLEIGVSSTYMLEALRAADCEEVNIEFSGALSPIMITPTTGREFIYLILPVRLPPLPKDKDGE